MAAYNPLPLRKLAEQFASLPGIGNKTAQRLSYYILTMPREQVEEFSKALTDAHERIKNCEICKNFSEENKCPICLDTERDFSTVCVVESPKDIAAFERTREYKGVYHVLHGLISPMDGIGPEQIYIKELLNRVKASEASEAAKINEVIMATSPTVEGEATAMYISKLLKTLGIVVSRIAYGMPVGSELEYADEITLTKALENRNYL